MTYAKQNLENCTLKQLRAIQANQYRSVDNSVDFCCFEIENRIIDIEMKRAEMLLKAASLAYEIEVDKSPVDPQMIALMTVNEPGRAILGMISNALAALATKKTQNLVEKSQQGINAKNDDSQVAEIITESKIATKKAKKSLVAKWPVNVKGSFNRGGLKKLLSAGLIEAKCDYVYTDDYAFDAAYNFQKTDWMPAGFSEDHGQGKTANFSSWDLSTRSGCAWVNNDGTATLLIHRNESWTLRFKQ